MSKIKERRKIVSNTSFELGASGNTNFLIYASSLDIILDILRIVSEVPLFYRYYNLLRE